jgi:hypothetical protein
MQSFPLATVLAVNPETVGVQSAFVRALAGAAVNTEIAERLETAKIKGIEDATRRRALRMKTARFRAIPVSFPSSPADNCSFYDQALSELVEP